MENALEAEIIEAATIANAHDFIRFGTAKVPCPRNTIRIYFLWLN